MIDKIKALVLERLAEDGHDDCYIVAVEVPSRQIVNVFIDSDSQMTFKICQRVSRHLESFLDASDKLDDKYTLEVSSPGIDRPLTMHRQYVKNIGRKLKLKTDEGDFEGPLLKVSDEGITVEVKVKEKVDGKSKRVKIEKDFLFENINKAVVKISFN